ncbi:MAG TPA: sulfite exporter TauE/SafE family protein [Caldithrix abyssi]|uniref:Probable membrane transporter protein n=1 Tax=Caldithrix abyssi TaxID=187145 RepID=A0A7V4WTH0_CALAY|nr:sulfite exporter TauE/SafE family protein [Caldithrix abyssi]
MELIALVTLFFVGTLAGFINVLAGGGSSLTLPALILLGLDSATANGTNRLAILVQNILAITGFEQEKQNQFKLSFRLALFTLPGAVCGALLAINISDLWFQRILTVIIILVAASLFVPKPGGRNQKNLDKENKWQGYLFLFLLGFYGGFIQVGIGFLLMVVLYHFIDRSLVKVNVHKVFIVFLYTIPALFVFILSGQIDWILGFALAAGNGTGGWIAARLSVKKGDKIVRFVLALMLLFMAVKLAGQSL